MNPRKIKWWQSILLWAVVYAVLATFFEHIGVGQFLSGSLCAIASIVIEEKLNELLRLKSLIEKK